jgi:hypothetical protein
MSGVRPGGARGLGRLVGPREVDLERGAVPRLAVHADVTAALLHDAEHRRQAQSRAFAHGLRREEGLEDPPARRRVHAGARVADRDHDVVARRHADVGARVRRVELHVRRLDRELSPLRHGVARVHREVHDDLLDLPWVRQNAPQIRPARERELDVLTEESAQHEATRKAFGAIAHGLLQQAQTLAYIDTIRIFAAITAAMIPLAFIMKRDDPGGRAPAH